MNRPMHRGRAIRSCAAMLLAALAPFTLARAEDSPTLGIRGAAAPLTGVVTDGQPSLDELRAAAAAGLKTVVNLRAPGEAGEIADERAQVEALGLTYVSIPIAGTDDLNVENACRLRRALEAADARPALVHCGSSNRVGALFALEAFRLGGATAEDALRTGHAAGLTTLESAVRERFERIETDADACPDALTGGVPRR